VDGGPLFLISHGRHAAWSTRLFTLRVSLRRLTEILSVPPAYDGAIDHFAHDTFPMQPPLPSALWSPGTG